MLFALQIVFQSLTKIGMVSNMFDPVGVARSIDHFSIMPMSTYALLFPSTVFYLLFTLLPCILFTSDTKHIHMGLDMVSDLS